MAENDNLALWKAVERTPLDETKKITGKAYQGNSPKPHYLIRKATEMFGPCGIGWGFSVVDERIEEGAGGERLHIARVKVWYKWNGERGEVEHIGGTQFSGTRNNGKSFTDEDAPKKSVTDALVKALSMIGFAGDIFSGRYDDSKYLSELRDEANGNGHKTAPASDTPFDDDEADKAASAYVDKCMEIIVAAKDPEDLKSWWMGEGDNRRKHRLTAEEVEGLKTMVMKRMAAIKANAKETA